MSLYIYIYESGSDINIYDKSYLKTLINKHLKKTQGPNNFSFALYPLVDTIFILF